tara:strand:- start:6349 stop:18570 length:12222 start_codon:yes stop_codon:yes gene_type:complete
MAINDTKDTSVGNPIGHETNFWKDNKVSEQFKESMRLIREGGTDPSNPLGYASGALSKSDAAGLLDNTAFIKDIYDFYYDRDQKTFSGPEEAIDYFFNDRTGKNVNTAHITKEVIDATTSNSAEQNARLARLQKTFDALPHFYQEGGRGSAGFWNNVKHVLLDPANLLGFGFGAIGAKAAARKVAQESMKALMKQNLKGVQKQGAKQAIRAKAKKEAIKAGAIRGGIVEGGASGAIEGVQTDLQQRRNIKVGLQDDYSIGSTALATGVGAAAGGLLGAGFGTLGALAPLHKHRTKLGGGLKFEPAWAKGLREGHKEAYARHLADVKEANMKSDLGEGNAPEVQAIRKEHFDSYEDELRANLSLLEEQLPQGYRARIVAGEEIPGYGRGEDAMLRKLVDDGVIDQSLADDILERRGALSAHLKMKSAPEEITKMISDAETMTAQLTDMEQRGLREEKTYQELSIKRDDLLTRANDYRRAYDNYNKILVDYKETGKGIEQLISTSQSLPSARVDADVTADTTGTKPVAEEPTTTTTTEKAIPEGIKPEDDATIQKATEPEPTEAELATVEVNKKLDKAKSEFTRVSDALVDNRNARRRITEGATRANRNLNADEKAELKNIEAQRKKLLTEKNKFQKEASKLEQDLDNLSNEIQQTKDTATKVEETQAELKEANLKDTGEIPTIDSEINKAANSDETSIGFLKALGYEEGLIKKALRIELKGLKKNSDKVLARQKFINKKTDEFFAKQEVEELFAQLVADDVSKGKFTQTSELEFGLVPFDIPKIRAIFQASYDASPGDANIKAKKLGDINRYYDEYVRTNSTKLFVAMANEMPDVPYEEVLKEINIRFGSEMADVLTQVMSGGGKQSVKFTRKPIKDFLKEIQPDLAKLQPHERRMVDRAIVKMRELLDTQVGKTMDDNFIRAALRGAIEKVIANREGGRKVFSVEQGKPASQADVDLAPEMGRIHVQGGKMTINGKLVDVGTRAGKIQGILRGSNKYGYHGRLLEDRYKDGEKISGEDAALTGMQQSWIDNASGRWMNDPHKFQGYDKNGNKTNKINEILDGGTAEGTNAQSVLRAEEARKILRADRLKENKYNKAVEDGENPPRPKLLTPEEVAKIRRELEQPVNKGGSDLITMSRDLGSRTADNLERIELSNKEVTAPLYPNNTDKNGFFALQLAETGEKVTPANLVTIDGVRFKKLRVKYGTKKQSVSAGVMFDGRVYRSTDDIPQFNQKYIQSRDSLLEQLNNHLFELKNSTHLEITAETVVKQRTDPNYLAYRIISRIRARQDKKSENNQRLKRAEPGTNFKDIETQNAVLDNEIATLKDDLSKLGKLGLYKSRFRIKKAQKALDEAKDKGLIEQKNAEIEKKSAEKLLGTKITAEDELVGRGMADKAGLEDALNIARSKELNDAVQQLVRGEIDEAGLTAALKQIQAKYDKLLSDAIQDSKPVGKNKPEVVHMDGIEVDVANDFKFTDMEPVGRMNANLKLFDESLGRVFETKKGTFKIKSNELEFVPEFSSLELLKRNLPSIFKARVVKAFDDGLLQASSLTKKDEGKTFKVNNHKETNTYRNALEEPLDAPVDDASKEIVQSKNPYLTKTATDFKDKVPAGRRLAWMYTKEAKYPFVVRIVQPYQEDKPLAAIFGKTSEDGFVLGHTDASKRGTTKEAQLTFKPFDDQPQIKMPENRRADGKNKRNTMLDDPDIVNPREKPIRIKQAKELEIDQDALPNTNPPMKGKFRTLGDVMNEINNLEQVRWSDRRIKNKEEYKNFTVYMDFLYSILEREAPHGIIYDNVQRSTSLEQLRTIMTNRPVGSQPKHQMAVIFNLLRQIEGAETGQMPKFFEARDGFQYIPDGYTDPQTGKAVDGLNNSIGIGPMGSLGGDVAPDFAKIIHEIGHWAYANILSPTEKRHFWNSIGKYIDQDDVTAEGLRTRIGNILPGAASNELESPAEFFAEQFVQFALSRNKAGDVGTLSQLWSEVAKKVKHIMTKYFGLSMGEQATDFVDPDLIPLFQRIFPDNHKINRYMKVAEKYQPYGGRVSMLAKHMLHWDDVRLKILAAIDSGDLNSMLAVMGGRGSNQTDRTFFSEVIGESPHPLQELAQDNFTSLARPYLGREGSKTYLDYSTKQRRNRVRLLDGGKVTKGTDAEGNPNIKHQYQNAHFVRAKLKNMYWQIVEFQRQVDPDNLNGGVREVATDPEVLRQISDGEISKDVLSTVTQPEEVLNKIDNDLYASLDPEVQKLVDTQDVGADIGLPPIGNRGYTDNLVTAQARTATELDDTMKAKLILEEMLVVISDIQRDMRDQLTRNIPKNTLGEGVSIKLDKNGMPEFVATKNIISEGHRKRKAREKKLQAQNEAILAKQVIDIHNETIRDTNVELDKGLDTFDHKSSASSQDVFSIIRELSNSKISDARTKDLHKALHSKIRSTSELGDIEVSKADLYRVKVGKGANEKFAETPDEYIQAVIEAFQRSDDKAMGTAAKALKTLFNEEPNIIPKGPNVQRYIDTELSQTQGVSGENGIPANAPIHIKELLRKITHRDKLTEHTSRTMTYRLVNMLGNAQQDYLANTNFLSEQQFNGLFPDQMMHFGVSGVTKHINDSTLLNPLRKQMRKLGQSLREGKTGTSFIGIRGDVSSYTPIHEIGHVLYRGTFSNNQKKDIVSAYEEAILSGSEEAMKISRAYDDINTYAQAEEWFVDGLHNFLTNKETRVGRYKNIVQSPKLARLIDDIIEKMAYMLNGLIGNKSIRQKYRYLTFYGDMFFNRQATKNPHTYIADATNNRAVDSVDAPRYAQEVIQSYDPRRELSAREYVGAREGEPLMEYVEFHGTISGKTFDKAGNPEAKLEPSSSNALYGEGIYLTKKPQLSQKYTENTHYDALIKLIDSADTPPEKRARAEALAEEIAHLEYAKDLEQGKLDSIQWSEGTKRSSQEMFDSPGISSDVPADAPAMRHLRHIKRIAKFNKDKEALLNTLRELTGAEYKGKVLPLLVQKNKTMDFRESALYTIGRVGDRTGGLRDLMPILGELNASKIVEDVQMASMIDRLGMVEADGSFSGHDFWDELLEAVKASNRIDDREAKEMITQAFREAGYDSFNVTETDGVTSNAIDTTVVFDSHQVKHVDARMFDPSEPSIYYNRLNPESETPAGSLLSDKIDLGENIVPGDYVYVGANAQRWGASDALQPILRKTIKKEPLTVEEVNTTGIIGHKRNLIRENSAHARRIGAKWFADKVKPEAGVGIYQKHTSDMAKTVRPIVDAMMNLPDAQGAFKNWIRKSAPLLSPKVISKPLSWVGLRDAGKVSQPASHKRILSAIRRDDLSKLSSDEKQVAVMVVNAFRKELEDMQGLGINVGNIHLRGKKYYIPQIWDSVAVSENPGKFLESLTRYIIRERRSVGEVISRQKASEHANKIFKKITNDDGHISLDDNLRNQISSDPFYQRFINLNPDEVPEFEGFMVNDLAGIITRYYDKTTRKKIMANEFGVGGHGLDAYKSVGVDGPEKGAEILMSTQTGRTKMGEMDSQIVVETIVVPRLHGHTMESAQKLVMDAYEHIHSGTGSSMSTRKANAINMILGEYNLSNVSPAQYKNIKHRVEGIVNGMADFDQQLNVDNAVWLDRFIDVLDKKPFIQSSAHMNKWSRRARAFNSITLLSWTTLTSIPDIILPAVRSGNFLAWAKAWRQGMLSDPSYRQASKDIGVGIENLVHDRMTHMAGEDSQQFSNAFFNATMLTPWTNFQREISALVGFNAFKSEIDKAHRLMKKGDTTSTAYKNSMRFLERYGMAEYVSEGNLGDIRAHVADDKVRYAVMRFVNESIFTPDPNDVPTWAQTPWGAVMFQLKSFPLMMGRMAKYALDEAGVTGKLPLGSNMKPLMALATVAPIFGMTANATKDIILQRGGVDEETGEDRVFRQRLASKQIWGKLAKEIFGADVDNWATDDDSLNALMGAYWEGILAMGGLGLIAEMMHSSATQIDNGAYGRERLISTIFGPTAGAGLDFFKVVEGGYSAVADDGGTNAKERTATRILARRVPVLGGMKGVTEDIVDTVAGERSSGSSGGSYKTLQERLEAQYKGATSIEGSIAKALAKYGKQ